MPTFATYLTDLIDQRVNATVDPRPTPFPVARTIGEGTRDGRLHLVDGDGASLCEAFTQQQLQRLHLAWYDVVTVARCRACEVLGSSPTRP
jgi:hypothetical protein